MIFVINTHDPEFQNSQNPSCCIIFFLQVHHAKMKFSTIDDNALDITYIVKDIRVIHVTTHQKNSCLSLQ